MGSLELLVILELFIIIMLVLILDLIFTQKRSLTAKLFFAFGLAFIILFVYSLTLNTSVTALVIYFLLGLLFLVISEFAAR